MPLLRHAQGPQECDEGGVPLWRGGLGTGPLVGGWVGLPRAECFLLTHPQGCPFPSKVGCARNRNIGRTMDPGMGAQSGAAGDSPSCPHLTSPHCCSALSLVLSEKRDTGQGLRCVRQTASILGMKWMKSCGIAKQS